MRHGYDRHEVDGFAVGYHGRARPVTLRLATAVVLSYSPSRMKLGTLALVAAGARPCRDRKYIWVLYNAGFIHLNIIWAESKR
jgi:hypothetical protein